MAGGRRRTRSNCGDSRWAVAKTRRLLELIFGPFGVLNLFETSQGLAAVVGSHNLTGGAFGGKNIEVSVLLEGDADDGFATASRLAAVH